MWGVGGAHNVSQQEAEEGEAEEEEEEEEEEDRDDVASSCSSVRSTRGDGEMMGWWGVGLGSRSELDE